MQRLSILAVVLTSRQTQNPRVPLPSPDKDSQKEDGEISTHNPHLEKPAFGTPSPLHSQTLHISPAGNARGRCPLSEVKAASPAGPGRTGIPTGPATSGGADGAL